jgi:diguanylate cyclase (GGDEF)-like protein
VCGGSFIVLTNSVRRLLIVAAIAATLLAVSYTLVIRSVNELLNAESVNRANAWAGTMMTQVSDLEKILSGETPSDDTVLFLEQIRTVSDVFCYKLYDKNGALVINSSHIGRGGSTSDKLSLDLRKRVIEGNRVVASRKGKTKYEPATLSEITVAIARNGETLGFLKLEIDETGRSSSTKAVVSTLAVTLLGLLLFAFGVPSIGFLRRTSEKERAEGQLEYLAFHDGLTGLKNRNAITRILDRTVTQSGNSMCALHMIDLDNFKTINDTKGHDAGDMLLKEVANRISRVSEGIADVGRLGGDEFVIIQYNVRRTQQVEAFGQQLLNAMKKPVTFNGFEIDTGTSIGSAIFPIDSNNATDLMKSADTALYVAKSDGRGCQRMFKPEYDSKMQRRSLVENKVRLALTNNTFYLAFQPIFNLQTKRMVSVEALLRLNDPEVGQISPAEFIPIAEEAGLIEDIGDWVIGESCRALALMPSQMRLALNLSAVQFYRGDLVSTVMKAIAANKIDPRRLELEITESLLLKNSTDVQDKIKRLKALGCSLALDDFGSGYSSLSYLWRYPFDKIKIDREFVAALSSNPDVEGIVEIILHLAKKLKMVVTAEGIETYEQELALASLGCDQVQGFLYSKPVTMADLAPFFLRDFYGKHHSQPKLVVEQQRISA